ncbi:NrsF family protein, partial [Acinetobacter baumannii]
DRGIVVRSFGIALVVGIALALCAAIVLLGTRPDLATARTAVFVAVKLAFSTTVFALSALYLLRLARPGGEYRVSPALMAAPFVAVVG